MSKKSKSFINSFKKSFKEALNLNTSSQEKGAQYWWNYFTARRRNFQMGSRSDTTFTGVRAGRQDIDNTLTTDLNQMRLNSRYLKNNNAYYNRYLNLLRNNVVGDGFSLKVMAEVKNGLDKDLNRIVKENWLKWSSRENCDVAGINSFTQLCFIALETTATDGECLIRLVKEKKSKKNKFGFKIQLLKTDRLPLDLNVVGEDYIIRQGIQKDLVGRVQGYWIQKYDVKNFHETTAISISDCEFLSIDEVIHLYDPQFPEQTRGYPFAHSVAVSLFDLQEFHDSCLMAGKIGSAAGIYLTKEQGAPEHDMPGADYEDENGDQVLELGFGSITRLPAGYNFNSFQSNYPSDSYQVFTRRMGQQIAAGLGISHFYLFNDTQDLNYSTSRSIGKQENLTFTRLQNFMIDKFVSVVYKNFIEWTLLNETLIDSENIPLDPLLLDELCKHQFIGRKAESVDPLRDEMSDDLAHKSLVKPLTTRLAEKGLDIEEVLKLYKEEDELIKKYLGNDYREKYTELTKDLLNKGFEMIEEEKNK